MNTGMHTLNELIEITRDGHHFYQHAAEVVKDRELCNLFRDMAQAKVQIIQALSVKVAAHHERPSPDGTLSGRMRERYADTRAHLGNEQATYVTQLEEMEDRILQAFEAALKDAEPDVRALLAIELPKIRACHERMRHLRQDLA